MRKSYAYKLIRAAKESAQCSIGHKPAKQAKVEPSKDDLAAEFDLDVELKALDQMVNRWENVLSREGYLEALFRGDCRDLRDHIISQSVSKPIKTDAGSVGETGFE